MEKNPKKRITMEKIISNKWLNKGFKSNLKDEIAFEKKQLEEIKK